MLFKSNKFFDLKSQKNISERVIQKSMLLKTCDHTVEYWQLSIKVCQFFSFLLHVTGKSYHFLRFNYLEMCYFLVYLNVCETQVHKCRESAIFGIPHPKLYKSFVTDTL